MKRAFVTTYWAGDAVAYQSHVWARSRPEAIRLANRRRIGELVMESHDEAWSEPASVVLTSRCYGWAEKMHALVWLAHLALSARVATARDLTDEGRGILHMFAHHTTNNLERGDFARLIQAVKRIERRVPGYLRDRNPSPSGEAKKARRRS